MSPGPSVTVKNPKAQISLCLFTQLFDVKNKTAVRQVGADKSNIKAIRSGSMLWSNIPKRRGHTKINEKINKYLYNWIVHNSQVLQSPISKYCLKVYIGGNSKPQVVPKLLLQVSVRVSYSLSSLYYST